jgi:hypothetical protein
VSGMYYNGSIENYEKVQISGFFFRFLGGTSLFILLMELPPGTRLGVCQSFPMGMIIMSGDT